MATATAIVSASDIIQKSEANLNTILNHADSGYVLYDHDLHIVAFNELAQKFSALLYSKNLAQGNHLLFYFPKERHMALLDITKRVLNGEEITYEKCFDVNGDKKWIEVRWLNVKNAENKNWGLILASKDVTAAKLAALEREKITNDLIRRNKALEQFANITSHNLRAPVANIINLVQMMDMVNDEAERRLFLDYILSSSHALNKVIDDIHQILDVKRHFHEAREKIDFGQLVEDIKTSISVIMKRENVTLTYDFENAPYVCSLRSFLYSIFYNLVLNSIKYKKPGIAPQIHISSVTIGNNVTLKFSDNGKGIDLKLHGEKLFGLYRRFDTSVEGSGLGLFMIKSQVEELGGCVTVESEVGIGTSFIITLPG